MCTCKVVQGLQTCLEQVNARYEKITGLPPGSSWLAQYIHLCDLLLIMQCFIAMKLCLIINIIVWDTTQDLYTLMEKSVYRIEIIFQQSSRHMLQVYTSKAKQVLKDQQTFLPLKWYSAHFFESLVMLYGENSKYNYSFSQVVLFNTPCSKQFIKLTSLDNTENDLPIIHLFGPHYTVRERVLKVHLSSF